MSTQTNTMGATAEVLAEPWETWTHPSGAFTLLPRMEHQHRRTRGGDPVEITVAPGHVDTRNRSWKRRGRMSGYRSVAGFHDERSEDGWVA